MRSGIEKYCMSRSTPYFERIEGAARGSTVGQAICHMPFCAAQKSGGFYSWGVAARNQELRLRARVANPCCRLERESWGTHGRFDADDAVGFCAQRRAPRAKSRLFQAFSSVGPPSSLAFGENEQRRRNQTRHKPMVRTSCRFSFATTGRDWASKHEQ